jgi:hypothetical protein
MLLPLTGPFFFFFLGKRLEKERAIVASKAGHSLPSEAISTRLKQLSPLPRQRRGNGLRFFATESIFGDVFSYFFLISERRKKWERQPLCVDASSRSSTCSAGVCGVCVACVPSAEREKNKRDRYLISIRRI